MATEIEKLEESFKSSKIGRLFNLIGEWKNFLRQNPDIRSYRYAAYVFLADNQNIVNKPYTSSFSGTNDLITILSNIRIPDISQTA